MEKIKETLKEIILENQEIRTDNLIKRDLIVERIEKKATIILGIRRCGKTSLLLEYINSLILDGVDKNQICHIDFSDDRLISINNDEPRVVSDSYYELFPGNHGKRVYFIFDEIQYLNNWEYLVNRLQSTENCEVNITGSSSKILLNETSSVLGGRKLGWNLYCYSYREFLRAKGEEPTTLIPKQIKDKQVGLFNEYLKIGGFPEALLFSLDASRTLFFQNIINDILFRDIILRHNISKPEALKTMVIVLFSMMSSPLSETKLYQRLVGMHVRISKPTMSEYLEYAIESCTFYLVPIRSYNEAVKATNPKKLYVADHALAAASGGFISNNIGAKLENIVFLHIRRKTDKVFYYKTKSGYEVDFAYGNDFDVKLVQVSADIVNEETFSREKRSLIEAMAELNLKESTIVTLGEEDEVVEENMVIRIIPVWKYLLLDM